MIAIIASSLIEHLDNKHMLKISQALLHLAIKQTYELNNTDPILQLKIAKLRELKFYRL